MAERYFEDFAVGQTFTSAKPLRVDKDDIFAFAKKYDPQPFHLDEEAARQSIFQGLSASGWHTAAITMRLINDSDFKAAGGTIGLGFEGMRWPIPVRPGDELRIESEILELRPSQIAARPRVDEGADADPQPERRNRAGTHRQCHGAAAPKALTLMMRRRRRPGVTLLTAASAAAIGLRPVVTTEAY